jgi:hypothetical protein
MSYESGKGPNNLNVFVAHDPQLDANIRFISSGALATFTDCRFKEAMREHPCSCGLLSEIISWKLRLLVLSVMQAGSDERLMPTIINTYSA